MNRWFTTKRVSLGIDEFMHSGEDVKNSVQYQRRAAQVRHMWQSVVDDYLCRHTNAVYIKQEGDLRELIVYVDESMIAAELQAQQELITFRLLKHHNEHIDRCKFLVSRGRYKEYYPFTKSTEVQKTKDRITPVPPTVEQMQWISQGLHTIEDPILRSSLEKAITTNLAWKNGLRSKKS